MMQVFRNPAYDFIGRRRWAYLVSAVVLTLGLGSMTLNGLRYGIDFTGGALIQLRFEQPAAIDRIREVLARLNLGETVIQEFGDPNEVLLRLPTGGAGLEAVSGRVVEALGREPTLGPPTVRRIEYVGPQVGRDLQLQAIYAVVWSVAGILAYIAFRFDLTGGVAAVVAIVHDVLICLGALSLTGREMSLPVLAALLTIVGYSVNDTIVAYDRLRENRGRAGARAGPFADQMNAAINQTLSRTVLTALTTFFAALVLFLFGGEVLQDFAFVLTVGVVTGTYSTIFIAGALITDWTAWREGRPRRSPAQAGGGRRSRRSA